MDVGCGNGKYLGVNPDVFIIGSDRYVQSQFGDPGTWETRRFDLWHERSNPCQIKGEREAAVVLLPDLQVVGVGA